MSRETKFEMAKNNRPCLNCLKGTTHQQSGEWKAHVRPRSAESSTQSSCMQIALRELTRGLQLLHIPE